MSCPSWCSRVHSDDEHVSAAEVVVPESDAALVTACLLSFDGGAQDGRSEVLVSVGVQQLELLDKPTVELRPAEARRLAGSLVRLAELAERRTSGATVVDLRAAERVRRPRVQQAT